MSNHPRKHHYLPEFYLNHFSENGRLFVFRKVLGRHHTAYDEVSAKGIGWLPNFYRFVDPEGNYNLGIETELFQQVDNDAAAVMEKLLSEQQISDDERVAFANFVAFQYLRGPSFQRFYNSMTADVLKNVIEFRNKVLEKRAKRTKEVTPKPLPTDFEAMIPREHSLGAMMDSVIEIADIILNFDWYFVKAGADVSFITSDSPFIMLLLERSSLYGPGFLTKNTLKILPLSSKMCFAMRDPGNGSKITYLQNTKKQVTAINANIALKAQEFIVGENLNLIRNIAELTKIDEVDPNKPKDKSP